MRIRLLIIALLGALAAPASAYAEAPPLSAKRGGCATGLVAVERVATFSASMPAMEGSARMWMRFELQVADRFKGPYRASAVPGLGVWRKSAKGRSGFVYTQRVQALAVPAFYRATVRYRWYDAAGKLLRSTRRTTPVCAQPDLRPDLRAGRLEAIRLPGGLARYTLVVRNVGRSVAAPAAVALSIGGAPAPATATASQIAPGGRTTVSIDGPRCAAGSPVRIVLDAAGLIDEADEAGNAVTRACPFSPAR
jgi:hypothetical protein